MCFFYPMETTPYKINEAAIEARKNISIFGKIKQYKGRDFYQKMEKPIQFKIANNDECEEELVTKPADVYKYTPSIPTKKKAMPSVDSNIYVPPSFYYEKTTVKITNIPQEVTRKALEEIIIKNSGLYPNSVNIALDRETRASRGFGFAEFNSKEHAKECVKKIDKFKIDGFLLGVEVIKDK